MGIRFGSIPGLPSIPTRVGPFEVNDARLQFSEPVLDISLIRRYRSLKQAADASQFDTEAARNKVVAMVANLYFGVQRARGIVDAARAQVELDEALLRLARDRREAGVGTGLDVTRSESRSASDRHSQLQAQNEARTAELRLLRAMGASLEQTFELADSLEPSTLRSESLPRAIELAVQNRPEIAAEQKKVEAARLGRGAARAERLPTIQAFADYGANGNLDALVATDTVGVQFSVPIFDGGRRAAHARNAESQLRQSEIRAKDVRDEIEMEVRVAFDTLASAHDQLAAAESALQLAQEELELSRLRYEAQVTTQIDVISAQTGLAAARSRRVNALYAVKSAEVEFRRALGER
jgi:outer membrane protein TolC